MTVEPGEDSESAHDKNPRPVHEVDSSEGANARGAGDLCAGSRLYTEKSSEAWFGIHSGLSTPRYWGHCAKERFRNLPGKTNGSSNAFQKAATHQPSFSPVWTGSWSSIIMDINFLKIAEYRYIGMGRSVETIQHLDYSVSVIILRLQW